MDGYAIGHRRWSRVELELLGDLLAARLITIVTVSAWRVVRYPENAEYIQAWDDDTWPMIEQFDAMGPDASHRRWERRRLPSPTPSWRAPGGGAWPGDHASTYARPVHVIRGQGVWLFEADGRRVLDAYNNVPVVGHCHPRVTEAVVRQTRAAQHPLALPVRAADRAGRAPDRDHAARTRSGHGHAGELGQRGERPRLADRAAATGSGGGMVTDFAYHGVTDAIADFSPEEWPDGLQARARRDARPPRCARRDVGGCELARSGHGLAATFLDGGFTSDGISTPAADESPAIARATHAAGGLFVADEVQAGHGRTGEHLWAFESSASRRTSSRWASRWATAIRSPRCHAARYRRAVRRRRPVFSTFGGNPVAARAALAVLDVIEDERLVEHARAGAGLAR